MLDSIEAVREPLLGLTPTFLLDRLLVVHPVQMPSGAAREAQISGIIAALVLRIAFALVVALLAAIVASAAVVVIVLLK